MEAMAVFKVNSKWFKISNHHYIFLRSRNGKLYFRCWLDSCQVTLRTPSFTAGQDEANVIGVHNHNPSMWVEQRNQLYTSLRERSVNETTPIRMIYAEEATRFPVGAVHLQFPENTMRTWRKSSLPTVPTTLQNLAEELERRPNISHYYQTRVVANGSAVIFASHYLVPLLQTGSAIFADGTFRSVPPTPRSSQLFTLLTLIEGQCFVILVALMENRETALYEAILRWIRDQIPPNSINAYWMTDFETGLQNSVRAVFPRLLISGCYFHFKQAIIKKARVLHLTRVLRDEEHLKFLKMLLATALLPSNQIGAAFQILKNLANERGYECFNALLLYFDAYWMQRISPARFSVYGLPCRTNNYAEAFHSALRRRFHGGAHPNIWVFISKINQIFDESTAKFTRFQQGLSRSSRVRGQCIRNDVRIRTAQMEFNNGSISIFEFLNRMSHQNDGIHLVDNDVPAIGEVVIDFAQVNDVAIDVIAPPFEMGVNVHLPQPQPENLLRQEANTSPTPGPSNAPVPPSSHHRPGICSVCLEVLANVVVMPCRHFCMCENCSNNVSNCPICRGEILSMLNVYHS